MHTETEIRAVAFRILTHQQDPRETEPSGLPNLREAFTDDGSETPTEPWTAQPPSPPRR